MKRVVSLALCLSLLIGAVTVKPQKTDAVILETASVVAAVAVIMTACGITYWANSQTDAINYIGGKIDEYLQTLEEPPATYEDWLDLHDGGALFEVLNGGIMRFGSAVANKILDFVHWLVEDEDITSNGEVVQAGGIAFNVVVSPDLEGRYTGTFDAKFVQDNILRVQFDNFKLQATGSEPSNYIAVIFTYPEYLSGKITFETVESQVTGQLYSVGTRAYNSSDPSVYKRGSSSNEYTFALGAVTIPTTVNNYNTIEIRYSPNHNYVVDGYIEYRIVSNQTATAYTNTITPSENVSIPSIGESESIDILPSVSLVAGDSVETASDVILEGVTSEQGLTSTVEEDASGGDGSLSGVLAVLQQIYDFVVGIPQAVYGLFQDVLGRIDTATQAIEQRILELPQQIEYALRDVFVPSESEVQAFVVSLEDAFANRFGLLTYPLSAVEGFVQRFSNEDWGSPVFSWGDIKEPFSGQILIHSGSYNLADTLNSEPMRELYEVYLLVVKAGFCGAFLELCRRKYNKVISDGRGAA